MEGRAFKTAGKPRGKPRANRAGKASQICGVRVNRKPPAESHVFIPAVYQNEIHVIKSTRKGAWSEPPPLSIAVSRSSGMQCISARTLGLLAKPKAGKTLLDHLLRAPPLEPPRHEPQPSEAPPTRRRWA